MKEKSVTVAKKTLPKAEYTLFSSETRSHHTRHTRRGGYELCLMLTHLPAVKVESRSECVFLRGRFWWGVSVTGSRERGWWGKGSPGEGVGDGECWRRSTPWNFPPPPPSPGRHEQKRQVRTWTGRLIYLDTE